MTNAVEKQWDSSPAFLFGTLSSEAARHPTSRADQVLDGGWQWRKLPDGVVVSMRTVGIEAGSLRYELRIAAETGFEGWDDRLPELMRELGLRCADGQRPCPFPGALWYRLAPQARDEGKLAARFVSLATGEITPPERWTRPEPEPHA